MRYTCQPTVFIYRVGKMVIAVTNSSELKTIKQS